MLIASIEEHIAREPTRRQPRGDWEAWEEQRLRELQTPTQKEESNTLSSSANAFSLVPTSENGIVLPLREFNLHAHNEYEIFKLTKYNAPRDKLTFVMRQFIRPWVSCQKYSQKLNSSTAEASASASSVPAGQTQCVGNSWHGAGP